MPPHCAFAPQRHRKISKTPKHVLEELDLPEGSRWNPLPDDTAIRGCARIRRRRGATPRSEDAAVDAAASEEPVDEEAPPDPEAVSPTVFSAVAAESFSSSSLRVGAVLGIKRLRIGLYGKRARIDDGCITFHLADPLINGRCSNVPRMPCDHIPGNPERAEHDQDKEYAKRLFFTSSVRHNHKYSERPANRPYVANTRA